MIAPGDHRHGSHRGYLLGCRQECCTHAHTRYMKLYRLGRTPKLVDSTGTVRRIQALAALGWSSADIGARCGRGREWARMVGRSASVTVRTAQLISAAYDELSMRLAPGDYAARLRREAAEKGWAPPLAWDDDAIDDPAASPHFGAQSGRGDVDEVAVLRRLAGDRIDVTVAERRTAVAQLWHQGLTAAVIARRCGFNEDTVEKDIERLGLRRNARAS